MKPVLVGLVGGITGVLKVINKWTKTPLSETLEKDRIEFTAMMRVVRDGNLPLGERAKLIEKLKKGYLEEPVSIGLAANGSVIEVFASNSGSFSIVITRPGGVSCLVAAGEHWLSLPAHKAETGI